MFKIKGVRGVGLTVAEVIAALAAFPPEAPVVACWEGLSIGFLAEDMVMGERGGVAVLEIDVDQYNQANNPLRPSAPEKLCDTGLDGVKNP